MTKQIDKAAKDKAAIVIAADNYAAYTDGKAINQNTIAYLKDNPIKILPINGACNKQHVTTLIHLYNIGIDRSGITAKDLPLLNSMIAIKRHISGKAFLTADFLNTANRVYIACCIKGFNAPDSKQHAQFIDTIKTMRLDTVKPIIQVMAAYYKVDAKDICKAINKAIGKIDNKDMQKHIAACIAA